MTTLPVEVRDLLEHEVDDADGPALYAAAATTHDRVAELIHEAERRFTTEIPMTGSGPWPVDERRAMRAALAALDAWRAPDD